jgi:cysteinyl-tRNA synthetase
MKKYVIPALLLCLCSCKKEKSPAIDYRQEMRNFVQEISAYARAIHPSFIIVPQNGHQLLTVNGDPSGTAATDYIQAIDGIGREDLFYGYNNDGEATPTNIRDEAVPFMNIARSKGLQVLVADYCSTPGKMTDSYSQNFINGYISFAADHRELDNIPSFPGFPYHSDSTDITVLTDARNFLYIINTEQYEGKQSFINALAATNYDVIVMDLYLNGDAFTAAEINSIKQKANGGIRKVICYMSIGEAEDYRYYWQSFWAGVPPHWLVAENPEWAGNYKVKYWDREWKNIIIGNPGSYTSRIINAGFDGAYLDIIDGFEYFEN